ncbi:hypothetical protein A2791_00180 [Candidatus Saccharibacteria bacterium RIFCSPHIGHO2_01_FULL_46_30]|nr:MAG: hypothetical protein A2791_00180 [Candidatus Saccharibacteria bacterium RIFCSPHIGHO2_01_FULL_46_30]
MPRKNNHVKHTPLQFVDREAGKKRFATKREAENAAEYQMLLKADLELFVYKSELNGGWYLTRKQTRDIQ